MSGVSIKKHLSTFTLFALQRLNNERPFFLTLSDVNGALFKLDGINPRRLVVESMLNSTLLVLDKAEFMASESFDRINCGAETYNKT